MSTQLILDKINSLCVDSKGKLIKCGIVDGDVQRNIAEMRKIIYQLKQELDNREAVQNPKGKLRSIKDTYKLIKGNDSCTSMTESGLRRLVNTGVIPCVRIGRNIKLNYDSVIEYMSNPPKQEVKDEGYGNIRIVQ